MDPALASFNLSPPTSTGCGPPTSLVVNSTISERAASKGIIASPWSDPAIRACQESRRSPRAASPPVWQDVHFPSRTCWTSAYWMAKSASLSPGGGTTSDADYTEATAPVFALPPPTPLPTPLPLIVVIIVVVLVIVILILLVPLPVLVPFVVLQLAVGGPDRIQ